ncbi:uncharacterized protein SPPG_05899 [Spizellomyces punctatus DAOM BR117]|uniref:AAA+ ATPase domain-containing protein n=1 Tax=Spizellomyces punctatus (strain DAOM BR117) TaxID=645134 RepID=A0A0L0HCN4_SPIPD|nr:uncharacterized protein SPPG_05899 [Spizellomyces punctatus DAOM BR117]KNC98937.1 hypothetical protein SPPG_05899 [Spizellomyces punctatus DAOM BR117]|eukprot:XP_016606977.1 hypothetical protein SPPG_05899 [Spizellomyces punctatus DAOM BR117]
MTADSLKPLLHIEVCLAPHSTARYDFTRRHVQDFLLTTYPSVVVHTTLSKDDFQDVDFLRINVEWIRVCEVHGAQDQTEVQALSSIILSIHVFQLNEEEGVDEISEEENVVTSNHWILPAKGLHGLWESLIYDNNIQLNLLDYVYTSMLFGDNGVDPHIISVNRVALLHGPPGTGKTSLCRALAQKLAIRLADRYSHGKLIEINSHSLFSKFFSESGKLVMKMFQQIHEMLEDDDAFVCVLIDEVESLSAARKAALSGMEPSDAIRVVNALLTQLDQLRKRKNVLILTTSNITEAIDVAFIDRVDIKQFIPPPSHRARYAILSSCLTELIQKRIIEQPETPLVDYREIDLYTCPTGGMQGREESLQLWKVAGDCEGFSGRTLRKLPFLAHAFFVSSNTSTLRAYTQALSMAVQAEKSNRAMVGLGGDM